MKLLSLNCNHCGAPLEVPAKARFVTCAFCDASLVVQRTGSTYSTSVLEEIRQTTHALARDVAEMKAASEIEQLDREWALQKEELLGQSKDGRMSVPTKTAAIGGAVAVGGFGLFWTVMAAGITGHSNAPGFLSCFPLFGLLFTAAAIFSGISMYSKADKFERAQRRYQRRRRDLGNR